VGERIRCPAEAFLVILLEQIDPQGATDRVGGAQQGGLAGATGTEQKQALACGEGEEPRKRTPGLSDKSGVLSIFVEGMCRFTENAFCCA